MTYKARVEYTGPAASYAFAFPYLDESHIKAYVAGVLDSSAALTNQNPDSGGEVILAVTPGASDLVVIQRETPSGAMVDFASSAVLTEDDLDTANRQALYVAEEADDRANVSILKDDSDGQWSAASLRIKDVDTPTASTDAANKAYVDAGLASQVAAAQAAQAAAEVAQAAAEAAEDGATSAQALAEAAEDAAVLAQGLAEDARDGANLWATESEDVQVNDGVNPAGYSAYHWAQKAAASAAQAATVLAGVLTFQGTWDASTGTLPTPVTSADFWYVSAGGSAGGFDFIQGDMLFYTEPGGTPTWYKVDNTEPTSWRADNDGAGSGLDADLLDGDHASAFAKLSSSPTFTGTAVAQQGMPMNSISGSTGTIGSGWNGYFFGLEDACTLTIPTNASDPIPVGAEIVFWQMSSGTVTFSPASGVTLRSKDGLTSLNGQYAAATLKKIAADDWVLIGDLA